jgi:signal transduction histidine kinase
MIREKIVFFCNTLWLFILTVFTYIAIAADTFPLIIRFGASVLIVLLFLFWDFRLKQEIKRRLQAEKEVRDANERLKKLDQLKSMIIASMSHELRTPLNSIIGFTGVMIMGMTGPLNDKQKDQLTRVNNSAKHLLRLITDIIDQSKIEAGRIEINPQSFLLSTVIKEAIVTIEPQLKSKKNLTLQKKVPDDIMLYTDKNRLLQCVINYLSNAVKYTEEGMITISASIQDDHLNLCVKDTGIGIAKDDIPKLFNAFERLDSHLKIKAGGPGLGLYLIRKLVTDILKGNVFVESQIGQGSIFGLVIPISISLKNEMKNTMMQ